MLICSTKKSLMQHHGAIKHCVKELCNAAELHVNVEASPFGKRDNSGKKDQKHPDLIIHNLTRRGSSLAIDISIANPFSQVKWFKSQTTGCCTQQRDRQDQKVCS